ncbi:MAG: hypothetical protein QNI88_15785 [Desulfobacterales bacterium]|nr:hypothetical protein [Desulfobacterales bacterium]
MVFFQDAGFTIRAHGADPCDHIDKSDGVGDLRSERCHALAVFLDQLFLDLQPLLQQGFGLVFGEQPTLEQHATDVLRGERILDIDWGHGCRSSMADTMSA